MLDVTHGRAQMDMLRRELDQCFTATVFDPVRFAAINQQMGKLLRDGITGTPVETRYGRPPNPNPSPNMLVQRAYRARLAIIRRANVVKRQAHTGPVESVPTTLRPSIR
jgi:hypothetical protein